MTATQPADRRFRVVILAALVYCLTITVTEPTFVGDAPEYANAVVAKFFGVDCGFLESGHVMWRPVGLALLHLFGSVQAGQSSGELVLADLWYLTVASWLAGLVVIVATSAWLWRVTQSFGATAFGVAVLLFSKAFLNFSQVGTPYIAALACLMSAVVLLPGARIRPTVTAIRSIGSGVLLTASVLLWGPFVLALPAALSVPVLLADDRRQGALAAGIAGVVCGGTGLIMLLWVASQLGLSSIDDFRVWVGSSAHGISTGGIPRAVVGFPRSFVETGDYGQMVKRLLIHDPLNPVRITELIAFPLLSIVVFYAGLLAMMALAATKKAGQRALAIFAINAVPVMGLAVLWQGGDLERYLALTLGIVLVAAEAYVAARSAATRVVLYAWLGMMILPNAAALSIPGVRAVQQNALRRLEGLPSTDGSGRLLVLSHWLDELVGFHRNFPWHPVNRRPDVFYHLLTPGTPSVDVWREGFAFRATEAWGRQEQVWVSERLLARVPQRNWDWVEGDDKRVSWSELHDFFARFEYDSLTNLTRDGFVLLKPTEHNAKLLAEDKPLAAQLEVLRGCVFAARVPDR